MTGMIFKEMDFSEFYSRLSFTPTSAQRRAVEEAARDMYSGRPMNRLIQGDVGSGKTLVAAA
jgi:ATP-dependent DNA helicase RecG